MIQLLTRLAQYLIDMKYNASLLRKNIMTRRVIELRISMDEAAKQIGISKATLCRIEKEKMPDIETFGKLVSWLNDTPNEYFLY